MTNERRAQILGHVKACRHPDEIEAMRRGLCAQGEMQDAQVFRAVWEKIEQLKGA
jgi:hypothetical protein